MKRGEIKAVILEVHPDAAANFDEKANSLLLELGPVPPRTPATPPFRSDPFVAAHITDADILGEVRLGLVDGVGAEVGKHFIDGGRIIGLEGEAFKRLIKISEGLQRTKELKEKVSTDLITNLIFDWMRQRYQKRTNLSMVKYVLEKAAQAIRDQEIWIPIAELRIQSDFRIGKITLRSITSEMFERWVEDANRAEPQHRKNLQELLERERKKFQSLAAATITLTAEPERARQLAFEETEDAIALLRFFSVANQSPELVSYCTVLGKGSRQTTTHLTIRNGQLVGINSRVVDRAPSEWNISESDVALFNNAGLEALSRVLRNEDRSSYQQRVLDALLLYSRSCLAKELPDKLIYILVPLESIFLKNEAEPVQQTIAERIAFFMADRASERRRIIGIVKEAYSFRSSFLHHGKSVEDVETLRVFMRTAWECFCYLIQNMERFHTVEQLLSGIDEAKLS